MKITDNYILFWSGIYSQWHLCQFKDEEGIIYNCAEQYLMYYKALLFNDEEIAQKIIISKSPKEQKALGRKVKNFDFDKWEAVCQEIAFKANYYKFTQNKEILEEIMLTGTKEFVEASPVDKIWGIGLAEDNPDCLDKAKWQGKNYLGQVLTRLRNELGNKLNSAL